MFVNADLHIHGKYARGSSKNMCIPAIGDGAHRKGIALMGTGDALHSAWREHLREELEVVAPGTYACNGTRFVITTEVEDLHRVHHLLILPSIEAADELYGRFKAHAVDIDRDGRPHVRQDGAQIAQAVTDVGGLFGPAHAFVPWTSLYKEYDSWKACYGAHTPHFLELGLSADSSYADRIEELQDLTFLSNSDAHSPWPLRLGREFSRFELRDCTFDELRQGIMRIQGRKPVLNVKLYPEEGKYNRTACTRCYAPYDGARAAGKPLRCAACGGLVKKGVRDRVGDLAAWSEPHHPTHRPPCVHLIPLGEILALALGRGVATKAVTVAWTALTDRFGDEITVLLEAPLGAIASHTSEDVARAIDAFRTEKIIMHPGGGGHYGTFELP